jgi:hypothetical protein
MAKSNAKSLLLKELPPDIYAMVLAEQNRIKEMRGICQFSMEKTIYCIIREFDKNRQREIKSSHNHF